MAELPPLPPGFTLDSAGSQELPPLPEGFTLDSPQASEAATSQPQEPPRTVLQETGRQVGLAGRAVAQGVASLPMMAMDAGVGLRNLTEQATRKYLPGVASTIDKVTGGGPGTPYEMPSTMFNQALTNVGVPEPKTATEKVTSFIETALAGSRIPAPQAAHQAPTGFTPTNVEAQVKNATLKSSQEAGYVVPPATSNPSVMNRAMEGMSGKAATAQQAAVRNQAVTNKLSRQALGMANDAPITPETLRSLRETAGQVYGAVAGSGRIAADAQYIDDLAKLGKGVDEITKDFPEANVGASKEVGKLVDSLLKDSFDAKSAMAYLKELRSQAAGNLSALTAADPSKRALGMAQREAAATLEDLIGRHLAQSGTPELAQSFQQARRLIAVTHTVENALNEATGSVSAAKLAKDLKGKPYGGELQVAAKFAQAFPKAAKEVTESMPGISPLDYYGSVGAAGLFGSPHLLLLPAVRMGIREALLSPWGQKAAIEASKAAGQAPTTLGAAGGVALATSSELRQ